MTAFTLCASAIGIASSIGGLCVVTQKRLHLMNKVPFIRSRYMLPGNINDIPCLYMVLGMEIHRGKMVKDVGTEDNMKFFNEGVGEPSKGCASVNGFKQNLKNGLFFGDMQITGSLIRGNEGIVVLEQIYYSNEADDINSRHEIFWVNKEEDGNWIMSNYKSFAWYWDIHNSSKTFSADSLLPKKPNFGIAENLGDYGGFVAADDIKNMRGGSSFNFEAIKSVKGFNSLLMWEGGDDNSQHSFSDGSPNLSERMKESFTHDKSNFKEPDFGKWKGQWSVQDIRYEDVTNDAKGYYGEWSQRGKKM